MSQHSAFIILFTPGYPVRLELLKSCLEEETNMEVKCSATQQLCDLGHI